MKGPATQRGLGWLGLLFIFGMIGFTALLTMKCLPIYLNQMKITRAVNSVAQSAEVRNSQSVEPARAALGRFWIVEDIIYISPRDVKMLRTEAGRVLAYEYEARERLFGNVSIVFEFSEKVPIPGGDG
ncbi:MAG: DUF4845 domain-containing protein [Gammaproteobacteria bacterium]|jgi:hypothetical protein